MQNKKQCCGDRQQNYVMGFLGVFLQYKSSSKSNLSQIGLKVTFHIVTPLKECWSWHVSGALYISYPRNSFFVAELSGLFYQKIIPQDGMRPNFALAKIRGVESN